MSLKFAGNLGNTDSGPAGSRTPTVLITGQVNTFADLPDPVLNADKVFEVLNSTGVYLINRKVKGMYLSESGVWIPWESDQYALDGLNAHTVSTTAHGNSGSNTGDETTSTIKGKLGQASPSLDGYLASGDFATFAAKQAPLGFTAVPNTRQVNGHPLSSDVTVSKSDIGLGLVPNIDTTNPTNISGDATHRFATDAEKITWNAKQDALDFTPVPITRQVNGHALSGDIILTKSDVGLSAVPNVDTTNPSNITQDSTHRFATDVEKSTWNGKQDALGYVPVQSNIAIVGATKTKITYDSKGLVTSGDFATTADIADSTNKRYVNDSQLTRLANIDSFATVATDNYNIPTSSVLLYADTSLSSLTWNLPNATTCSGYIVEIYVLGSYILNVQSVSLVDGNSYKVRVYAGECPRFRSNGTRWYIL